MKIITNNVPRQLIYGYELSPVEKSEFDYIDDIDTHDFFRYKGFIYDPSEFMRVPTGCTPDFGQKDSEVFPGWHGYQPNSYFSGILLKYTDERVSGDCDEVIVGRYST